MHIHVGIFCHIERHLGKKVSILRTLLGWPWFDPTRSLLCRDGGVRPDTTRHDGTTPSWRRDRQPWRQLYHINIR